MHTFHISVLELKHRGKLSADGLPQIAVFHRRQPNDCCWKNRIGAASDGRDVEDGILPREGIETVVVSEGAFEFCFSGVAVAFNDDVCLCRNPQILSQGFGDAKRSLSENSCELVF